MSFPVPDERALEALRLTYIFLYCAPFVSIALAGLLLWARPRRARYDIRGECKNGFQLAWEAEQRRLKAEQRR